VTLQETAPKRRNLQPNAPLDVGKLGRLHDNQVLTIPEWRRLNRLPERTGRRILKDPDPKKRPVLTQLSPKRYGITVRHNREWQESRAR
jgi:hypothetical protein